MSELGGRIAVITGGSRGIGFAIARSFRAQGAHVVLAARKLETLREARDMLLSDSAPGDVHIVVANAGEPDQADACIRETVERFGRLDVLVNNAATNPYMGDLIGLDLSRAEKTVRVNQYGMVAWTGFAWDHSMQTHGGTIVNIASVGGMIVDPGIGWYNATKAAMIHLTRQLAWELGPKVRVNAIAPGLIKTELARAVWEEREGILTAQLPMRRLGTPEDVADLAVFLAGDRSSWITGQTIVIDGGALTLPVGILP